VRAYVMTRFVGNDVVREILLKDSDGRDIGVVNEYEWRQLCEQAKKDLEAQTNALRQWRKPD
jgi:hypothetical protein